VPVLKGIDHNFRHYMDEKKREREREKREKNENDENHVNRNGSSMLLKTLRTMLLLVVELMLGPGN
jgi:hypothetical protein